MLALCLTASTAYSPALAAEADRAVLKAGQKAPFDGVLLTHEALALLVTELDGQVKRLEVRLAAAVSEQKIKAEAEAAKCDAKVEAEKAKAGACEGARAKEQAIYEKALDKANDTPFWKSPTLMTILGIGVTAAACAAIK